MAPAHSSFEQALAGVTTFATAVESDTDSDIPRSKKAKRQKEKEKKDKSNKKSSKQKKQSKVKKRKKRASNSDGDSSGSEHETVEIQLARGRAAIKCVRTIMSRMPQAKKSLRQMLWRLDHQEAVDISSIPDQDLLKLLQLAFDNLKLLKVKEGVYVKAKKGESLLGQLGHVLDEIPAEPSASTAAVMTNGQIAAAAQAVHEQTVNGTAQGKIPADPGPAGYTEDDREDGAAEIGVALPENWGQQQEGVDEEDSEEAEKLAELSNPTRRVLGPALPPQVLLDQAAEVAEAMAAEQRMIDADVMIGPPPPEMVQEAEAIPGDARSAEVVRVLNVLQAAKLREEKADAYKVIGLAQDCQAGEVKRRYWKLSLLIHPDKCTHPRAQDAFNAVSQAAKNLQDADKRAEIDKELERHEYQAFEAEQLQQQERARQWRVARGEGTNEDLKGPLKGGPATREEWITVLPESRRPSKPSQKSQTTFSQQGVAAVKQEAHDWSDTPAQKLLRLQHAGESMMPALEASAEQEKAAAKAKAVDAYNETHRAKPLMEQHADKSKKRKRDKSSKDKGTAGEEADWEGSHPWRPFDREKDMQTTKPKNQAEMVKKMGELTSRFGTGSSGPRKFL